ncbi:transposase [Nonomuraea sp. NPDC050022]|uniref:transposase n=1 Tax=Nonomuraea sp. NPDC050022 TaxID=3364358 RepID=UPI0037991CE0
MAGPQVLGVDDFALRRGHSYGTILIDMSTSTVVDVLADRTADTLAAWRRAHPGVEIVCRDRTCAYAEGIAWGTPHGPKSRTGGTSGGTSARLSNAPSSGTATTSKLWPTSRVPVPTRLHLRRRPPCPARPRSVRTASPRGPATGMPPFTPCSSKVKGCGRSPTCCPWAQHRAALRPRGPSDDLLVHAGTGRRPKNLEAYDSYLRERWAERCANAEVLYRELQALGYRGSGTTLRQYVRPWRAATSPAPTSPRPPTVRQATGWFLRNPAKLDADDHHGLQALTTACPHLGVLRLRVRQFAEMMMHRHGQNLETWMNTEPFSGSLAGALVTA